MLQQTSYVVYWQLLFQIDNIAVHTLSEKQIVMLTHAKRISLTIRREGYFTGIVVGVEGTDPGLFSVAKGLLSFDFSWARFLVSG